MNNILYDVRLFVFALILSLLSGTSTGQPLIPHPVPEEFSSAYYRVEVNGQEVPVFHAGLNVYFASFDFSGEVNVIVTSMRDNSGYSGETASKELKIEGAGYWGEKPVVRPLSKDVKPELNGKTVSFSIHEAGQYSVEREGTGHFKDDALFLFANHPETERPSPDDPDVIYLKAGIHQQHIDMKSGQTLFLEAGAVLFGSINVWNAEDVRILGRGTVVYYGPQSETRDDGWKHRRNWRPLTTHNTQGLTVEGVTFITRSRTWSIQMHTTFDAVFDNVKVIAVNPQNINGDGFDWYGGGRTRITNCLVLSMDDCFAFFTPDASLDMWSEGKITEGEVKDILIENCVLWSTLANIYRVGFKGQALRTDNIVMKNCDVIHISKGQWFAPWSLICAVSPTGQGKGVHASFHFESIRFEEPCALLGLQNEEARFKNIIFKDIVMDGEPVPSLVNSNVENLTFDNVRLDGKLVTSQDDVPIKIISNDNTNMKFLSGK